MSTNISIYVGVYIKIDKFPFVYSEVIVPEFVCKGAGKKCSRIFNMEKFCPECGVPLKYVKERGEKEYLPSWDIIEELKLSKKFYTRGDLDVLIPSNDKSIGMDIDISYEDQEVKLPKLLPDEMILNFKKKYIKELEAIVSLGAKIKIKHGIIIYYA